MNSKVVEKIAGFVEENIGHFHQRRLERLKKVRLDDVLKRRNPYLYKAKGIEMAHDLVQAILDDFITQHERTIFGGFLEELALFTATIYGGHKSSAEGVDLEFKKDGIHYLVSIKSGPHWGNSSEVKKQCENFRTAKKRIAASRSAVPTQAVLGCCFGRTAKQPDKGDYKKICGQQFWGFLSGERDLYLDIIQPIGHQAKTRNAEYQKSYAVLVNLATQDFSRRFCAQGKIDWEGIVRFNSATVQREVKP